jgi:hypothetical protein
MPGFYALAVADEGHAQAIASMDYATLHRPAGRVGQPSPGTQREASFFEINVIYVMPRISMFTINIWNFHGNFTIDIGDCNQGDFTMKQVDFTIKHGDFTMKNGD